MSVRDIRKYFADVVNAAAVRGAVTYVTNRGRRLAAIVPVSVAEATERVGGPDKLLELVNEYAPAAEVSSGE